MDISKKHVEFRNLEYNFMIDNGYLLFDKIKDTSDEPNVNLILKSITDNLMSKTQKITKIDVPSWDLITPNNYSRSVIVGFAKNDLTESLRPGQHFAVNHLMNHRINENNLQEIKSYNFNMKKGQFAFFHPLQLYQQLDWKDGVVQSNIMWFMVESEPILRDDGTINNNLWGSWDILKKNIEFTPLDELTESVFSQYFPATYYSKDDCKKIWDDLNHIEHNGIGELIKLTSSQLVFRIRPIGNNDQEVFIKLGQPSIYESVIEIVYFMDHRTDDDRFEIRTIGVLSRACNVLFSRELSELCTIEPNEFHLDLEKVIQRMINIDYNEKILEWFPRTPGEVIDETDLLHLKFKKRYDVCVYKFEFMDVKFLPRINMILSWMKELELKGGFILSDPKNYKSPGYMILGGDDTNADSKSDIHVFQERFKCLHWKKVKHYHYSNHDYISQINYDDLPNNNFCYQINEIIQSDDENHQLLREIMDNI